MNEQAIFEKNCELILKEKGVIFAGIISKNGKLISGGHKHGTHIFDESKNEIMFMEQVLMNSMNREFDALLGKVGFTMTKRERATIITCAIGTALFFVIADPIASIDDITSRLEKITEEFSILA